MINGSARKELSNQAVSIIRVEFDNAILSLCQHHSFDHSDLSPSQLAKLLQNLLCEPLSDSPLLDATQRQALIVAARTKYGAEIVNPILHQIFPNLSLRPGTDLVQVLNELGPEITSDVDTVRALFRRYGLTDSSPPNDAQVAEIISSMSRHASEGGQLCDVNALVRAIASFHTSLNWPALVHVFDRPDRGGVDTATLKLLISILLNAPREEPHAVTGFWMEWRNSLHQLRLLDALLSLPGDTFNFVLVPGRRVVTVDDVAGASPTIKALAANVQGQTWNSLSLFETLIHFGNSDQAEIQACVRDMLDKAVKISAELVHMGLLQVPKPWNALQAEYSGKMLAMFLAGHPNHQLVFMRIWQIDPTYLTTAFTDFYHDNQLNITRILDIAQDLKILDTLLAVRPFTFALDVAALASRREYLNLDKWLADNIADHGAEFLRAVIEFLDAKTASEKETRVTEPAAESRTMALSPQTIAIFLRVLRNNSSVLAPGDVDYCLEIRNACLQIHPRLMNLTPGSEQEPGFSVVSYSAEIEKEVDSIYKQMYDENISIDQVIALLQRSKTSKNPRDHEIFSCMLHFLFDEFKFFNCYPDRELHMTGYLFGSLIQYNLVDYIPLGIAIRYVLDALQCPPDTNLFKFGIQALSRFETRLPEWQPLCQALLRIPHLLEARPDLATNLRRALNTVDDAGSERSVPQAQGDTIQTTFSSIRPDALPDNWQEPSEEVSDKILFIVNNLAPSNFESKVDEMKERFQPDYSRWFAHYLVDQRVSTEPNNHQLYLRFLDSLSKPDLHKLIVHETFVKSAALLNSEMTQKSTTERTILKNLGAWLGTVTLARNKPIKHKNMAFKEFLLEGYDTNRLIVAIPFVCKILEACAKSTIFKPPNPWLMAVIALLVELYHFAELKLNLKFEIEVLCKTLDIDLTRIDASTVLRNRPIMDTLAGPPLPEYVSDIDALPIGGYDPSHLPSDQQQISLLSTSSDVDPAHRVVGSHIEGILGNLSNLVVINAQLAPLHTNHSFRRAVTVAIDRGVREIIVPVVERSVTIAGISSRELVSKDFAMEGSEDKMRKAALLMAQKLAGSLALVTCKEPLKSNLGAHIRHALTEQGFNEQMVSEQVIGMLVLDNIEAACAAIERAAMDRAVMEIDDALAPAYEMRRRHREVRPGLPFWDAAGANLEFLAHLPDPLRIKPNGLQLPQWRVYEDFLGFDPKRKLSARPTSTLPYPSAEHLASTFNSRSPVLEVADRNLTAPSLLSQAEVMERFVVMTHELEMLVTQFPNQPLSALPVAHEVKQLIRQILFCAAQSTDRDKVALQMSQRIVQHLYKTASQLGREAYVTILDQLCRSFPEVQKEATEWLIYAEDERKYNVPVTVTLLRSGLIPVAQQDAQLARLMWREARPSLIDFTANLIRECLAGDTPVATQAQFQDSLSTLLRAAELGKLTERGSLLLEDLGRVAKSRTTLASAESVADPTIKADYGHLHDRLFVWFQQWVMIFQRSPSPEKAFIPFVSQLQKEGILKQDDVSFLFFRICTEASIESYTGAVTGEGIDPEAAFEAIDAMSKLIALIIRYHGEASASNNDQLKAHYLTKILSIVVVVLAHAHEEQGTSFQQKPYFRFFSSLFNDLHAIEPHVGSAYFPLMIALSDTFSSLQPIYFPGFAFSWMCLISHRLFMPKLLSSESREGWSAFHTLLVSLFKFLGFFLNALDLKDAARDLYRGAVRILLVLLHDFPEFLAEYYFSICEAIPPKCIQLRNVVLSAFPMHVVLPDPYLRNLQLESLSDIGPIPPILSDFTSALQPGELRTYLDHFLLNRGTTSFLPSLKERLRIADGSPNPEKYNLSLINSLVMYIGVSSVAQAKARSGSAVFVASDPGVVILQYLAMNLNVEGQHHLLSSMVLHLRYPNAHTHWFSSLLLHLFVEVKDEVFCELMTKVLLERFIGHRPHPWGALVTFIELLRNPKYEFWSREFTRIAPEITMLLEGVSIGGPLLRER
ncbi:Not1-domain-containing protein [Sistotremastrum suecicum HHB10207 ss-3]|uniref:General negative regulator of transcription subunit 1 n=1 Tax=Sistotremastrum suecicum HHB10207 ss-3 TaxID=1314776 RepID=A0A166IXL1_9AGAM|nr:Not1-domain-containing protein [Sistotremastrum suecicum HHB10207 ss-3]